MSKKSFTESFPFPNNIPSVETIIEKYNIAIKNKFKRIELDVYKKEFNDFFNFLLDEIQNEQYQNFFIELNSIIIRSKGDLTGDSFISTLKLIEKNTYENNFSLNIEQNEILHARYKEFKEKVGFPNENELKVLQQQNLKAR